MYHYTSQRGLLGIIKTKSLWLTQVACLNDLSEVSHAFSLMKAAILKIKPNEEQPVQMFCDHLINLMDTNSVPRFNIFVISFSENGDLLSQWRGYCSDGGYSIGFDYETFEKLLTTEGPIPNAIDVELGKCIYDPDEQNKIITEILDNTVERYRELIKKSSVSVLDADRINIILNYMIPLYRLAPLMKNESFAEEQEWRLIVTLTKNSDISYREGIKWIIPYYKLNMVKSEEFLRVKEIIVGPTLDQFAAINSLERFLQSERVAYGRVTASRIPFRG